MRYFEFEKIIKHILSEMKSCKNEKWSYVLKNSMHNQKSS